MKEGLSLLVALLLGAIVTYVLTAPRHAEEWGVVVADGDGARVHGLFESKRECLKARAAFVEKYAAVWGKVGRVEKTTRSVAAKNVPVTGSDELTTFSCLPFNDIRGLSFQTFQHRADDKKE